MMQNEPMKLPYENANLKHSQICSVNAATRQSLEDINSSNNKAIHKIIDGGLGLGFFKFTE